VILHRAPPETPWTIVRPTNVWGPWHPTFGEQIWRYIDKGLYLHPRGRDPRRSYGFVANVVHQIMRITDLPPDVVNHQTFYVGDEPLESSVWLDAFSQALRGRPVRRVPYGVLYVAAELGELSARVGGPHPLDRGRLYRMTSDYAVPMERTFDVLGRGPVSLSEGVARTVAWLRRTR
jgi:GlcNAc-P-P-Und epimerase